MNDEFLIKKIEVIEQLKRKVKIWLIQIIINNDERNKSWVVGDTSNPGTK